MANSDKQTYWPHMILGFFVLGISLGYWTVKSANSMPVQESNTFMMKYQQADLSINEIIEKKRLFDANYSIELVGKERMVMTDNINSNLPQENPVALVKGKNSFSYRILNRERGVVLDANVSFLLTRPHTAVDDFKATSVVMKDGSYIIEETEISKAGRYTLLLRAKIGDGVGYSEIPAYLKP